MVVGGPHGRTVLAGRRGWIVAVVAVLAVAGLVSALLVRGAQHSRPAARAGGTHHSATPTTPPPTPVLAAARGTDPAPTASGVSRALRSALADPHLGGRIAAQVVDVTSGRTLLDERGAVPTTPASTAKVLTSVAVFAALPDDHRFTTQVVAGPKPGQVVLVGGGDPTLSAAGPGSAPAYAGAARISDLAAAVHRAGVRRVTEVLVDDHTFVGPVTAPGWDSDDVSGGYVAPIMATMVDGGRIRPDQEARSSAPDLAAGRALAVALGAPKVPVVRGSAPRGARRLGQVQSAPVDRIVGQMLAVSDNTLAECLARQVALATKAPGSFAGAASAVRQVLSGVGVPAAGISLVDGSGLSRRDAVSPAALTQTLRIAASPDRARLHDVFPLLPVAGYAGTLANRYRTGTSAVAAGQIRAKTGTLTAISSLAGVVQDDNGRLLAFAFLADRVSPGGTLSAESALDALAGRLAGCGCR